MELMLNLETLSMRAKYANEAISELVDDIVNSDDVTRRDVMGFAITCITEHIQRLAEECYDQCEKENDK